MTNPSFTALPFCSLLACLGMSVLAGCNSADSAGGRNGSERVKLQGSGASFPAPLYLRWFKDLEKTDASLRVDYQAKGSGAGIQDLLNQTVDFAASDAALSSEEIAKVDRGVVMLPLTAGKIVLAYNLADGPSELRLSREAYSKILMGEVTRWNDPIIVDCNGGASLPDTPITVVVRSDSSGTTHVLSMHLAEISSTWKEKFGVSKTIPWPNVSHIVKAPKNDGVMALIKQTPGAIGYVEYGYAVQTKQSMATLENASGKYVKPSTESGQAALASVAHIPDDLVVSIPDPGSADSYPIVSYTWIVCYQDYPEKSKSASIRKLVEYCLSEGQASSGAIGYIPLPEVMVEKVREASQKIQ